MNLDALLLFTNAFLSMLLGAGIIFWILRREYRPTLTRLESEAAKPGQDVEAE